MYNNIIGQKKAIDICKYIYKLAAEKNKTDQLVYTIKFINHGESILPQYLMLIINEIKNCRRNANISIAYEDTNKLYSYFQSFLPTTLQIDFITIHGKDEILEYLKANNLM